MKLFKRKRVPNTKLQKAEQVKQKYLKYGQIVANVAKEAFLVGGNKALAKFNKSLELK